MRLPKISRRNFIRFAFYSLPVCCFIDGFLIEPTWIAIRKIKIGQSPNHRIVHFSDLHYKGDKSYLTRVIKEINELFPDFVCFTGDIVEDTFYLQEALEALKGICYPVFGVPGNHDYRSGASFTEIAACFEATGGAWLVDREMTTADGELVIVGSAGKDANFMQTVAKRKRLLLVHYPDFISEVKNKTFDLILAGHSHGGQLRIPFWGTLILPSRVGKYDKGLFQTEAGPLYVNVGIGTWYLPARFCCRPEITVIEF